MRSSNGPRSDHAFVIPPAPGLQKPDFVSADQDRPISGAPSMRSSVGRGNSSTPILEPAPGLEHPNFGNLNQDRPISGAPSMRTGTPAPEQLPTQQDLNGLARDIDIARQALESQLNALRAADPQHLHQDMQDNGRARLQNLNLLRDQLVGGANGMSLNSIRTEVLFAVGSTLAYTSDIKAAVSPADQAAAAQQALYSASADAERTTRDFEKDFYERRIFDPYLKFTSAADEEAYRQREAERQKEIEKARAEHTPQGELRAVNLSIDQLNDAGAHGADASPAYRPQMDDLVKNRDRLTSAIEAKQTPASKQTDQITPVVTETPDPLAGIGAKAPDAKGAVAALLAAGISGPQSDNVGHGVSQSNSPIQSNRTI